MDIVWVDSNKTSHIYEGAVLHDYNEKAKEQCVHVFPANELPPSYAKHPNPLDFTSILSTHLPDVEPYEDDSCCCFPASSPWYDKVEADHRCFLNAAIAVMRDQPVVVWGYDDEATVKLFRRMALADTFKKPKFPIRYIIAQYAFGPYQLVSDPDPEYSSVQYYIPNSQYWISNS